MDKYISKYTGLEIDSAIEKALNNKINHGNFFGDLDIIGGENGVKLNSVVWISENAKSPFPSSWGWVETWAALDNSIVQRATKTDGETWVRGYYYRKNEGIAKWTAWKRIDAQQTELDDHKNNKNNPHGVTTAQIGAAPAGFGLGGNSTPKATTDITANGWYLINEGTPTPDNTNKYYICHSFVTNNGDDITVEAWNMNGTEKWKRTKRGGTWGDWKPMAEAIGAVSEDTFEIFKNETKISRGNYNKDTNKSLNIIGEGGVKLNSVIWVTADHPDNPFGNNVWCFVETWGSADNSVIQRATRTSGAVLVRTYYYKNQTDGFQWTNWTEPYVSIVAAGTSGKWTYRKWSNGIAECWSKQEIFCDGTRSDRISFPFGFIEEPIVELSEEFISENRFVGGIQLRYETQDGFYMNFTIAAKILELSSQTQATVNSIESTERFTVHCIGKWK